MASNDILRNIRRNTVRHVRSNKRNLNEMDYKEVTRAMQIYQNFGNEYEGFLHHTLIILMQLFLNIVKPLTPKYEGFLVNAWEMGEIKRGTKNISGTIWNKVTDPKRKDENGVSLNVPYASFVENGFRAIYDKYQHKIYRAGEVFTPGKHFMKKAVEKLNQIIDEVYDNEFEIFCKQHGIK